jgi:hypothetical protein
MVFGFRLCVARQDQMTPVRGGQMNIDYLRVFEFLQCRARCQTQSRALHLVFEPERARHPPRVSLPQVRQLVLVQIDSFGELMPTDQDTSLSREDRIPNKWAVTKAIMSRSARVLMEGWVRAPADTL